MAWFECVGGNGGESIETASIFRWIYQGATTCWGLLKKDDGDVIGRNADLSTSDILLNGNYMSVLFHGNSQSITVTANQDITLSAYSTTQTLSTLSPTTYTLLKDATQTFTPDNLYGGLYLEARLS